MSGVANERAIGYRLSAVGWKGCLADSREPTAESFRLVEQLRQKLGRWAGNDEVGMTNSRMTNDECEAGHSSFGIRHSSFTHSSFPDVFSSGTAAIDRLLPGGGLRHGMLVEWLGGARNDEIRMTNDESFAHSSFPSASGTATLSLLSAREACRTGGTLVVIDRERTFYPPAAAAWGIDLDRLIVVRPTSAREELWAAVQALRSPVVAAVWGAIPACREFDSRALRRLQLAAEAGRTLGLFLRPASVRGQPSWADVQLGAVGYRLSAIGQKGGGRRAKSKEPEEIFGPQPSTLCSWQYSTDSREPTADSRLVQVHVLRMRGGRAGGSTLLEIDDAMHAVREVKEGYRLSAVGYQPSLLADSRKPTAS